MSTPITVNLENVSCPMGCGNNDELILTGRDLLHGLPGEYTVVKCRNCGLMRTNPRPTPDTISFYYPEDYGPYVGTRVQHARLNSGSWVKKLMRPLLKRLFNFNLTPLPTMKPGKMLEIGCASGAFMHQMSNQGWQVQGIEFSEKAALAAAKLGHRVHVGSLETASQLDAPFDLIVGWMVLEHLHDPVVGLKKLREWAKPDAWLAISIPDAGSFEFRIFKDKWYALQLPTHMFHYTPSTLEKVLLLSGWKLEKIHHQRILNNLIISTGNVLMIRGHEKIGKYLCNYSKKPGKMNYLLYPLAWVLSIFGQTGRMTVWARPNI